MSRSEVDLPLECQWLLCNLDKTLAQGMKSLLDCNWSEASDLFGKCADKDPNYASGMCLVSVLRYLSSFEEEHRIKAFETLTISEKLVKSSNSPLNLLIIKLNQQTNKISRLCAEIIQVYLDNLQADCSLFYALLCLISHDLAGFIKGGWALKKAVTAYEKSFENAKRLYNQYLPQDLTFAQRMGDNCDEFDGIESDNDSFHSTNDDINEKKFKSMEQIIVEQLMSSVSLGYGLFNLGLSILSPQLLKLISFLGFSCDRQLGLKALRFASKTGHPLKEKQACLSLLWYNLLLKPYLGVHSDSIRNGIHECESIINSLSAEMDTTLLLFFRGRIARISKENDGGMSMFERGLKSAEHQRELQVVFCYELGFGHVSHLNYLQASEYFDKLVAISKWAPPFSLYLTCISRGSAGDLNIAKEGFLKAPKIMRNKSNPLEQWVVTKCKFLTDNWNQVTSDILKLHCLELLHLWNSINFIPKEMVDKHIKYCNELIEIPCNNIWLPLCHLSLATLQTQIHELQNANKSILNCMQCHETIVKQGKYKLDNQVIAFASYEMACIYNKMNDPQNAMIWLDKSKTLCKGFKMENRLSLRLHAFTDIH